MKRIEITSHPRDAAEPMSPAYVPVFKTACWWRFKAGGRWHLWPCVDAICPECDYLPEEILPTHRLEPEAGDECEVLIADQWWRCSVRHSPSSGGLVCEVSIGAVMAATATVRPIPGTTMVNGALWQEPVAPPVAEPRPPQPGDTRPRHSMRPTGWVRKVGSHELCWVCDRNDPNDHWSLEFWDCYEESNARNHYLPADTPELPESERVNWDEVKPESAKVEMPTLTAEEIRTLVIHHEQLADRGRNWLRDNSREEVSEIREYLDRIEGHDKRAEEWQRAYTAVLAK